MPHRGLPFFWDITLPHLVIKSRRFKANLRSHLQGSKCKNRNRYVKKRPPRCLETSGSDYQRRSVKSQENEILGYTCRNLTTRKCYHEQRNPSMVTVVPPHYSTRKAGKGCYKYTNFNVAGAREGGGGVATDKRSQLAVRSQKRKYTYSFPNFRRVLNVVCFFLGNFPLWILYADVSEHSVCSIFIGG